MEQGAQGSADAGPAAFRAADGPAREPARTRTAGAGRQTPRDGLGAGAAGAEWDTSRDRSGAGDAGVGRDTSRDGLGVGDVGAGRESSRNGLGAGAAGAGRDTSRERSGAGDAGAGRDTSRDGLGAGDVPAGREAPRDRAGARDVARGEHTHGEIPVPRARPLVQRSSVRGQVLDALRAALVAGELRPGEVYSAPALGERFGVSATPVREAMQQLALEGAVEVVPNRGFRVVERGARELAELAEVRALIETPVVLRLARTVPAERWAGLRPLAEATVRAASANCRATYAETDRAFHRAVLALAGNEQLVRVADDLHRRAQWPLVGGPAARGRADLVAAAHDHTALLDALIAGDQEAVRALLHQHFTTR